MFIGFDQVPDCEEEVISKPSESIMGNETVKVAVRVRPLLKPEVQRKFQNIIQKTPSQPQIVVNSKNKNDLFTFNYVFEPEDTNKMIYENAVEPIMSNLFKGKNLAYFIRTLLPSIETMIHSTVYFLCYLY